VRATLAAALVAALGVAASAGATPAPFQQVDVSHAKGLQAEVALAVDPANDQVLLAGSNSVGDGGRGFSRVYSSTDGGATWTSASGPPPVRDPHERRCSFGDPTVAFGPGGVEYYGFLTAPCALEEATFGAAAEEHERHLGPDSPRVLFEVASRPGPTAGWRTAAVFPVRSLRFDDKPAIAVDVSPSSPHLGRVYAAWSKTVLAGKRGRQLPKTVIAVAWSDDGAAHWSRPVTVSGGAREEPPVFASLALDRAGTLFLAWTDDRQQIWLDRSGDGGASWRRDLLVDTARAVQARPCDTPGLSIPAQAVRCITPVPTVLVDDREGVPERVFVTYSAAGEGGRQQDVFVAAFDGSLAPLLGPRTGARQQVNPPDGASPSDQFMPAAAADRANGAVWVCYYDTSADRRRQRALYTCTASADGGSTWTTPVRAASTPSNTTVSRASTFQFGDYQGLAVANGVAHPIWTDTRDLASLREEIYTTVLTDADVGLQPAQ